MSTVSPCNSAPGLASVPGLSGEDGKLQLLLFYNTMNSNLGVQLRKGTKGGADEQENTVVPWSTDQVGFLVNPTQLGAAQLSGTNVVVGFTTSPKSTNKCDCCSSCPCTVTQDATNHDLSIVSPVYRSLAQTETGNYTVAICSSSKIAGDPDQDPDAWVYYLKGTDTKNIMEFSIRDGKAQKLGNVTNVVSGSSLASYWNPDTGKRFVIYQASNDEGDDSVGELEEHTEGNTLHIENGSDSVKGTTLAVTYASGKVYLYYTSAGGKIRRIIKTGEGWGSSDSVPKANANPIHSQSQLSVLTSDGVNHLLYVDKDGKWIHIDDPLKS